MELRSSRSYSYFFVVSKYLSEFYTYFDTLLNLHFRRSCCNFVTELISELFGTHESLMDFPTGFCDRNGCR